MMQCSRDFFHLFVAQRAWAPQEARLYTDAAMRSALEPIFLHYGVNSSAAADHKSKQSIKSNSNKKRKTAWITPRKGIWYVFKHVLSAGWNMKGLKKRCREPELRSLAVAVALSSLPHRKLITSAEINHNIRRDYTILHKVIISYSTGYDMNFYVERGDSELKWTMYDRDGGLFYSMDRCRRKRAYFRAWRKFVLKQDLPSCWTPLFIKHVGGKK